MAYGEYERFMLTLRGDEVPDDLRKMANLVQANFEELQPLGTALGKRAQKLRDLAQAGWHEVSATIDERESGNHETRPRVTRLRSLTVGPFRGFAKEEKISLDSAVVLIHGPNGSGKSSFCEALEYCLLGSVEEARSKRFTTAKKYLRNAHVGRFVEPSIEAIDGSGQEVALVADEEIYRFCFVEKNRIDSFARIAARPPKEQIELISSLFGLEKFNDFVNDFSRDIEKYFDIEGKQGKALREKQLELIGHRKVIEDNETALEELEKLDSALAARYAEGATFAQLMEKLGTDETPGDIQTLERALQKQVPPQTGLTSSYLEQIGEDIVAEQETWLDLDAELTSKAQLVSYRQLFTAVQELQADSLEKCPACGTPLEEVREDPYSRAKSELAKLETLADLQSRHQRSGTKLSETLETLRSDIEKCASFFGEDPELDRVRTFLADREAIDSNGFEELRVQPNQGVSLWSLVEDAIRRLEKRDEAVAADLAAREAKKSKLAELRRLKDDVSKHEAKREILKNAKAKAEAAIRTFEDNNKELIEAAEAEVAVVARNKQILAAYASFVAKLNEHKERLPASLVASLGQAVVELYNGFNRADDPSEQLSEVWLPTNASERIEIAFKGDSETRHDALHILSEGHIRCLGLAIVLAKNLASDSPFLIFDDPVNAIDHEHRGAIRETLFRDSYFRGKQIILACHGNEFFKDLCQAAGSKDLANFREYQFLRQNGEKHIQVSDPLRPTNYLLQASVCIAQSDSRDALMCSRRALEHLSEKTWRHYNRHRHKNDKLVSVQMREPGSPWELRGLADKLRVLLKGSKTEIPGSESIQKALSRLLGVDGSDFHWVYLNKGTHEEQDREEFLDETVLEIVESLNELESALLDSRS